MVLIRGTDHFDVPLTVNTSNYLFLEEQCPIGKPRERKDTKTRLSVESRGSVVTPRKPVWNRRITVRGSWRPIVQRTSSGHEHCLLLSMTDQSQPLRTCYHRTNINFEGLRAEHISDGLSINQGFGKQKSSLHLVLCLYCLVTT